MKHTGEFIFQSTNGPLHMNGVQGLFSSLNALKRLNSLCKTEDSTTLKVC